MLVFLSPTWLSFRTRWVHAGRVTGTLTSCQLPFSADCAAPSLDQVVQGATHTARGGEGRNLLQPLLTSGHEVCLAVRGGAVRFVDTDDQDGASGDQRALARAILALHHTVQSALAAVGSVPSAGGASGRVPRQSTPGSGNRTMTPRASIGPPGSPWARGARSSPRAPRPSRAQRSPSLLIGGAATPRGNGGAAPNLSKMLTAQQSPRSPGSGGAGPAGSRLDRRASSRCDPLLESFLPALQASCNGLLGAAERNSLWELATPERVARWQRLADEVSHDPNALAQACSSGGSLLGGEAASQLSASAEALGRLNALVEQDARFSGSVLCHLGAGQSCLLRHGAVEADDLGSPDEEAAGPGAPELASEPGSASLLHLGTAAKTSVPQFRALRCVSDPGLRGGEAGVVAVDLDRIRCAVGDAERALLEAKAVLIAAAPPLSALPDGVRIKLAKAAVWQDVSYGTRLCTQGRAADHVFVLSAGAVRLSRGTGPASSRRGRAGAQAAPRRIFGTRHVEFSALHRPAVLCADLALQPEPWLAWCTATAQTDRVQLLVVPGDEARRAVASASSSAQRDLAERCHEVAASRQCAFRAAAAVLLPNAGFAAGSAPSFRTPRNVDADTIRAVVDEVNLAEVEDAAGGLLGGPAPGAAAPGLSAALPSSRSPVPPSSQRWIRSRRQRVERHEVPAFAMDSSLRRAPPTPVDALPLCATVREAPESSDGLSSPSGRFLRCVRRETARASRRRVERTREERPSSPRGAALASPRSPRDRPVRAATANGRSSLSAQSPQSPRSIRPSSPRVLRQRRRELATRRDRHRDKLRQFGLAPQGYGLAATSSKQHTVMASPLRVRMERWVEIIEDQPIRGAYYQCDGGDDLLD